MRSCGRASDPASVGCVVPVRCERMYLGRRARTLAVVPEAWQTSGCSVMLV